MQPLRFGYTNHRGEWSRREVVPARIRWGTQAPWYLEPQWLLDAYDNRKQDHRTFALSRMSAVPGAGRHPEFCLKIGIDYALPDDSDMVAIYSMDKRALDHIAANTPGVEVLNRDVLTPDRGWLETHDNWSPLPDHCQPGCDDGAEYAP